MKYSGGAHNAQKLSNLLYLEEKVRLLEAH